MKPDGPVKVLLRTPLNPYTGYGRDGIGIARALTRWGCEVYVEPLYVSVPLPHDVALLLTKHLRAPFDICIVHADPDNIDMSKIARQCSDVTVAWSMWEFSDAKPLAKKVSTFARRMGGFDAVLMYDMVALEAWRKYGPKRQAWGVLQGGYEPGEYKYFPGRNWHEDRLGFIMHGQLHNRKAPYVAIQAHNELWHEHEDYRSATLSLHTTIGDPLVVFGELIPRMKVFHEMWEKEVLEEFYHANHVLLAPSRGEGKNLPALEFMTTGGVVAATNWGGHQMWINPDYAYPLDYTLTPTVAEQPDMAQDAKVSVETMKETMYHIFTHRAEAQAKAERAAEIIPRMCDWAVVMERFWNQVRELVPGKGEELWIKAQQCRRE